MGSPATWGKLVAFEAALRKPMLIPFGLFSPNDNLAFIAGVSNTAPPVTTANVTFAATLVIDTSVAQVLSVTLTADVTSCTLNYAGGSTIADGLQVWLRIIQNATGGWTFALPTNLVTDPGYVVDPGASRATVLPIEWDDALSKWIFFSEPFSVPTA